MHATRNTTATAAVLAGALMAVSCPIAAHAQSPRVGGPVILSEGDGWYSLGNWNSNKVLTVQGGSNANGAKVVQQPLVQSGGQAIPDQDWLAVDAGGGYYSFRNAGTPDWKALGVDGASTAAGAGIIQATYSNHNNQDWRFEVIAAYPEGYYRMRNRHSGKCLGISGGSAATGVQAAQFTCDSARNQAWRLIDS